MNVDGLGTFRTVLLCDDIRREDNGKWIVAGIYSGEVLVESFPTTLNLRLFVEFEAFEVGHHRVDFEWLLDGHQVAYLQGSVDQQRVPGVVAIALPVVAIPLLHPSTIEIVVVSDNNLRQSIFSKSAMTFDQYNKLMAQLASREPN